MCRCAERGVIIHDAAAAVARGDLSTVVPAVVSVTVTSAQDAIAAARRLAHARLRR